MTLQEVAVTIGYLATIGGALVFIWKVWKQIKDVAEGQKCMLRSEIMNIYYRHCDDKEPVLREFERKNLDALYAAYERLHGNTFVSDIYKEMRGWHVSS